MYLMKYFAIGKPGFWVLHVIVIIGFLLLGAVVNF